MASLALAEGGLKQVVPPLVEALRTQLLREPPTCAGYACVGNSKPKDRFIWAVFCRVMPRLVIYEDWLINPSCFQTGKHVSKQPKQFKATETKH